MAMHAGKFVERLGCRRAALFCATAVLACGCDRPDAASTHRPSVMADSSGSFRPAAKPPPMAASTGEGSADGAKRVAPPSPADILLRWKFVEYEGGPENTIEVVVGRDRRITCEKQEEEGEGEKEEKSGTVSQAAIDAFFNEMVATRACHAGRKPPKGQVPGGPNAEEELELRGGGMDCTMGLCPDIEPGSRCARIHAALNTLMLAGCKTGTGL